MAVTLRDVAKATGVSPSTVSRVISDSPRIAEDTKVRVRKAMKELGYHPNFIARSLVNQSTNVMGVVFPSYGNATFQNPFFSEVLRAISEGAHEKQYGIQLTTGKTEKEIYHDVVQMVQGKRVDGILMLYSRSDDPIVTYLLEQDFPFVVIGQPSDKSDKITCVDNNNIAAAKEATQYLLELGYDRIGFIGGKDCFTMTSARIAGYQQALQEAKIPIRVDAIIQNEFQTTNGYQTLEKLMASDYRPNAFLVEDDFMAMDVLQTLREMGLKVPDDVAIIGFNNTLLSELSNPPLTSVDIHILELGVAAVKQLILRITDPKAPIKSTVIPHHIIGRQSC